MSSSIDEIHILFSIVKHVTGDFTTLHDYWHIFCKCQAEQGGNYLVHKSNRSELQQGIGLIGRKIGNCFSWSRTQGQDMLCGQVHVKCHIYVLIQPLWLKDDACHRLLDPVFWGKIFIFSYHLDLYKRSRFSWILCKRDCWSHDCLV